MRRLALAFLLAGCATAPSRETITITGPMLRGIDDDGTELIEGDIQPSPFGTRALASGRAWPFGIVPYLVEPEYWATSKLEVAMANITAASGILFVPRTTQEDYMVIRASGGCSSPVGYYGSGAQVVRLNPSSCSRRAVEHELLHLLGFQHEHTWPGRDEEIEVLGHCIEPGRANNFATHGGPHNGPEDRTDFLSIMMYASSAWATGEEGCTHTMVRRSDGGHWGWSQNMSPDDILGLELLYAEEIALRPDCPDPPGCDSCCRAPEPCDPCPEPPEIPDPIILHDRFEVRCGWRACDSKVGECPDFEDCLPIAASTHSALFGFWTDAVFELPVSVVDLRAITHSWGVYFGAATDAEFKICITDLEADSEKCWRKLGRAPAPAITDSAAFPEEP